MARPEKVQAVAEIKQRFEDAAAVFVTEYAGLSVPEQQELRRGLRQDDAEYKVLKMTLTRRAVADLAYGEGLGQLLTGPTALAFATGDPVKAAKTLAGFAKEHDQLRVKGMVFSGELLPPEKVGQLAALDPREVLLAKLAGAIQAPLSNLAGLLASFGRNAASLFLQLKQLKEQGEAVAEPTPEAVEEAAEAEEPDAREAAGARADEAQEQEEEPIGDSAPEADGEEEPEAAEAAEAEEA